MEPPKTDGPDHPRKQTGLTQSTVLYASVAGVAVSAPLLGMTAFTLLATTTLLLITSPLLFIFSPLILSAGFVLAASMVGFASAAAMAFCGVYALG
ncbi:hypothetical protein QJS04_geneDACA007837 [Acorus gramineus]|uniref:Oleosin n=1 Tax=Acorus gramineus TaxID=55184 RepID=A0AAV9B8K1_ACOGR|nr:hypothetical protein QJS04_geneDACA007837 [Acorus gramineus]